jgi:hypothetical protein
MAYGQEIVAITNHCGVAPGYDGKQAFGQNR